MKSSPNFWQTTVHPCVIDDVEHIIYTRGLQQSAPQLFEKLNKHYESKGYVVKEDQRSVESANKYHNQRKKWAPILLFSASLFFESSAFADVEINLDENLAMQAPQNIELQLISNSNIREKIKLRVDSAYTVVKIKSVLAQSIFDVLSKRYIKQKSDPNYILNDLKEVANYYSGFPESSALIESLKDKNWELSFDESNWVTTGSGNMMQVDKAVIHFNTRSAAQLRLNNGCADNPVCIASPADAMLHELLHVHSMLVETDKFISMGGMNNVLYPYQHEYAVISEERKLYANMSAEDNVKRPQRREHTGRTVKAHCSTCIK
ncbi:MAG: hypothetical protein QM484_13805 [Woeseiaceae bacterium]